MIVKLENIKRENGNTQDDLNRLGKKYGVYVAIVGRSAILPLLENEDKALTTSTVEDIRIFDRNLIIKTRNTEYIFEFVR